jgi:hypothetical protein
MPDARSNGQRLTDLNPATLLLLLLTRRVLHVDDAVHPSFSASQTAFLAGSRVCLAYHTKRSAAASADCLASSKPRHRLLALCTPSAKNRSGPEQCKTDAGRGLSSIPDIRKWQQSMWEGYIVPALCFDLKQGARLLWTIGPRRHAGGGRLHLLMLMVLTKVLPARLAISSILRLNGTKRLPPAPGKVGERL